MKKKTDVRWVVRIIVLSIVISVIFTLVSSELLDGSGYVVAFLVLCVFIIIGILFDMVGVAATSASEAPFHSMASHREKGAAESIALVRNAEKVSSVCNDVVGDIAGIISGATSAVIVGNLVKDLSVSSLVTQLIVTGLVAGLTIGGKAVGKSIAINSNTQIVLLCGKVIEFSKSIFKRK